MSRFLGERYHTEKTLGGDTQQNCTTGKPMISLITADECTMSASIDSSHILCSSHWGANCTK